MKMMLSYTVDKEREDVVRKANHDLPLAAITGTLQIDTEIVRVVDGTLFINDVRWCAISNIVAKVIKNEKTT